MPPTIATGVTITLRSGMIMSSATPLPKPSDSARCAPMKRHLPPKLTPRRCKRLVERVEREEERGLRHAGYPHDRRRHRHDPVQHEQRHRDRQIQENAEDRLPEAAQRQRDDLRATSAARTFSPVCTCSARSLRTPANGAVASRHEAT